MDLTAILTLLGAGMVAMLGLIVTVFKAGEKTGKQQSAKQTLESERKINEESSEQALAARAAADAARDDYDSLHDDPFNRDNRRSGKTR